MVACIAAALRSPADAAPHAASAPNASRCSTAVVFGAPQWHERSMIFRATVDVACPLGVSFSAALRSAQACELRSAAGPTLRYEMFADAAMQSAVVSCERATQPLRGVGRQTFIVYGRVDGPVEAIGQFTDALLATITA